LCTKEIENRPPPEKIMTAVPVANPLFEPGRGQPWIGYPEFAVQSLQLGSERFSY